MLKGQEYLVIYLFDGWQIVGSVVFLLQLLKLKEKGSIKFFVTEAAELIEWL